MYNVMNDSSIAIAASNDIQTALGPLSKMDNRALRDIVENELSADQYVQNIDLTTRKMMVGQNEMIMTENKSLAEYNLTFEPLLEAGKNNLKQLMVQIEGVRNAVQQKEEQLRTHSGAMSSETALALLQTSAAESEEDSDKLVELFYQNDADVEDFLEKFQQSRKRMHLRRVKAEKMADLITQKNARPISGPRRSAPLPPYPVGPTQFFNNV